MDSIEAHGQHPLEALYQARDALSRASHGIVVEGVAGDDDAAYDQAVTGVLAAFTELRLTLAAASTEDHPRLAHPESGYVAEYPFGSPLSRGERSMSWALGRPLSG